MYLKRSGHFPDCGVFVHIVPKCSGSGDSEIKHGPWGKQRFVGGKCCGPDLDSQSGVAGPSAPRLDADFPMTETAPPHPGPTFHSTLEKRSSTSLHSAEPGWALAAEGGPGPKSRACRLRSPSWSRGRGSRAARPLLRPRPGFVRSGARPVPSARKLTRPSPMPAPDTHQDTRPG